MNFAIEKLKSYLPNILRPQIASKSSLREALKKDGKQRISLNITKYRNFKAEKKQDNLKTARSQAEDIFLPTRENLYGIYKESMLDPYVRSQIRTQTLKITGSPWAIFEEGTDTIDEDCTRLLQRMWFNKYREYFHLTPYWGHQLVEFGAMVESKDPGKAQYEFEKVKIFPREHVKPETGEILLDLSHQTGIPYREEPWNEWIIEMGEDDDLGLLLIISREVIWKDYSRSDWSRACEKWGMPIAVIKAATGNKKELDELEEMAASFGSNLWLLLDSEDEFEIKERTQTKGYEIYSDKIKYCDMMIALTISGQQGTSQEKSFVGSAEVQERILNEFVEAGQRDETIHNNSVLFPFLIKHGYQLEGKEFRYMALENDEDETNDGDQEGKSGNEPPKKEPPKDKVNFTRPSAQVSAEGILMTLTDRIEELYATCCTTLEAALKLTDLTTIARRSADKVFDKKLSGGAIDKKLWQETVKQMIDSISSGYGKQVSGVKYGSPDHLLLTQFRYNVQVFAAFKNHHNTNELVKALVDDNGEIRSKSQFKKEAGLINKKYNKNWISTEYNQAKLAARNGYRWQKSQERTATFPNVEYVGVDDQRQSAICRDLDGGIWRHDDPILDTIAPSNHWGCRSFLKSSKKDVDAKSTGEDIKKAFRNNPGKTGHPFTEDHPYYSLQDQYRDTAQRLFGVGSLINLNLDRFRSNVKQVELLDRRAHNLTTYKESGGFMAIHTKADKGDLDMNRSVAEVLAKEKGYGVVIREHLEDGTPNPELLVNQVLSDVKTPKRPYGLDNLLRKAGKQGLDNVVWMVSGTPSLKDISKGLRRGFHNRSGIQYIDIIYKGKGLRVDRALFERGEIIKELELIWK